MPEATPPNSESPKEPTLPQKGNENPTAAPEASPAPIKKAGNSKKSAVTFIAVLGILAVVLVLLNLIPFDKLSDKVTETTAPPPVTVNPLFFKEPVYDEDFTLDSDYMDLDRRLNFTSLTGETFSVMDDAELYGDVCALFEQFRTAVTEGDCDAYNDLFTDEYIEKKGSASFAPQKLYNLRVAMLSSQLLSEGDSNGLYQGATVSYCKVEYCIKDNNGTFRNDFYRNGDSKAQIFEILDYKGKIKISQISTPTYSEPSENEKEGLPIMFYIWIALIVLAVVAEAMTTAIVAVWFIPGAIASMILALCGADLSIQLIVYFVSALVLLVAFKLLSKKFGKKKTYTPTNTDRLIGGTGVVTEAINNLAPTGEVKIDGKRWSARTEDDSMTVEEGALITVLRIEGVKLIVEKKN